jgi:hypothetical protein
MFQPFNKKCDICGRGKFKSQSGLTRHRDACQQKRREQSAHSRRQSLTSEECAVMNPRQFAELTENSDKPTLEEPDRDASPEPMLQSLTDEEYAVARPEDNEFEPMTTENLGRDTSPEPMLFGGATSSIQLSRTYGSLAAVHAQITSAETDLGRSINNSTEFLANLQNSQSQISNLQLELDILHRRRARMRLSEPSSSPRGASSSPAFSEISSVSDTDVVSVEYDDTDESSASGTVVTAISSFPGEVPAPGPCSW